MINTLILDDEQHAINRILDHLKPYSNKFKIIATCTTINEAITIIEEHPIDLVFLDIEIKEDTGFDFLNAVKPINFEVIFVTAFNEYATEAFENEALHYLLKPVSSKKFKIAIDRFLKKIEQQKWTPEKIGALVEKIYTKPKTSITISTEDHGIEILKIEDIIYMKADGKYTHIKMKDKRRLVSDHLKHYEDMTKNTSLFRIHKSHIINIDYMLRYINGNGGYIILKSGKPFSVSKLKKQSFKKFLNSR